MIEEIWRDVPSYEGLYKVSNKGQIKRLFENGKERYLVGKIDKDGYIQVILSKSQQKKYCTLHRIVAEAFIPNPDNKPQVNHKDRNKKNNVVNVNDLYGESTNLEWVTASENVQHCFLTGRKIHKTPVIQYTRDMKLVACWDSLADACKKLNINQSNISACCAGRLKTVGGFVWRKVGLTYE